MARRPTRPVAGALLATVGATAWTGQEADWRGSGTSMWWSHLDAHTCRAWLGSAGFVLERDEFVPEGNGGHQLLVARVPKPDECSDGVALPGGRAERESGEPPPCPQGVSHQVDLHLHLGLVGVTSAVLPLPQRLTPAAARGQSNA